MGRGTPLAVGILVNLLKDNEGSVWAPHGAESSSFHPPSCASPSPHSRSRGSPHCPWIEYTLLTYLLTTTLLHGKEQRAASGAAPRKIKQIPPSLMRLMIFLPGNGFLKTRSTLLPHLYTALPSLKTRKGKQKKESNTLLLYYTEKSNARLWVPHRARSS